MDRYWQLKGGHGLILRTALRTAQFLSAIITAGLYGADLALFTRQHQAANSTWLFAEVLVAFSAITGAAHCIFTVTHLLWCSWDAALSLMWMVVAILAGQQIFSDPDEQLAVGINAHDTHIHVSFAFDIINMLLWLATAMEACILCCTVRTIRRKQENSETADIPLQKIRSDEESGC
ncbi:hypothetical protein BKA67DRAFT_550621 [Truncatella angustata]|uniref:MARVEL domain-containing protein n=1 Tax=Truncatella angustata TaxID=152316 RepID=A0A9P8UXN1_9PEZI|nr:uncharacterized protein BKA67DRAFT_550621 [Truncatella angustata]KAH6661254.1 hypothetical protein BKA67DRAFT_550621 [Truncatella angustata]